MQKLKTKIKWYAWVPNVIGLDLETMFLLSIYLFLDCISISFDFGITRAYVLQGALYIDRFKWSRERKTKTNYVNFFWLRRLILLALTIEISCANQLTPATQGEFTNTASIRFTLCLRFYSDYGENGRVYFRKFSLLIFLFYKIDRTHVFRIRILRTQHRDW